MKTRLPFALLICLLMLFGKVLAQPRITFDATTIDIGTIPQGGPAIFEYPFTNTGDSPLVISMVKSSCGCVAPSYDRDPVKPGERGSIRARYDSNRLGPCTKTLTVACNDSSQAYIVLVLKCNVLALDPKLEISAVDLASLSLSVQEPNKNKIVGGDQCRPCIPAQSAGPYIMRVTNPNRQIANLDLLAYNDPQTGHFGVFFSKEFPPANLKDQLLQGWATQYTDKTSLAEGQSIYLVVNDAQWLRETIFKGDPEWAIPLGVSWREDRPK
jgi:hypothetical protein